MSDPNGGSDLLTKYRTSGHRRVKGWLTDTAILVLTQLAQIQRDMSITGPVCEIGVHHGRLFILLHLFTAKDERSVAWDLFERQGENADRSGNGDRDQLLYNLRAHGCDAARISVFTANSLDLTPEVILRDCQGRPRIFSIDGGHTAEVTLNDLRLAADTIPENGLIVLDDFFNESWPGVAEGACRFMDLKPGSLHPVLIAGNKFVFTGSERAAKAYRDAFSPLRGTHGHQLSTVFGQDVLIITEYRRTLKRRLLSSSVLRMLYSAARPARSRAGGAPPPSHPLGDG